MSAHTRLVGHSSLSEWLGECSFQVEWLSEWLSGHARLSG